MRRAAAGTAALICLDDEIQRSLQDNNEALETTFYLYQKFKLLLTVCHLHQQYFRL